MVKRQHNEIALMARPVVNLDDNHSQGPVVHRPKDVLVSNGLVFIQDVDPFQYPIGV